MDKNSIAVTILKKTLDMDEENVKLANHVKDCYFCKNLFEITSQKCFKHYKKVEN